MTIENPSKQHTPRRPFFRRYGWLTIITAPIVGAAIGLWWYGQAVEWYFLLPGVPSIERLRDDPGLLAPLSERLGVPTPTSLRNADTEIVTRFYEAYVNLRTHPTDPAAVERLCETFEASGDSDNAAACRQRAGQLRVK